MRNYHCSPLDLATRRHFGGGGAGTPPPMPKFEMPAQPKMPQAAPMAERVDQSVDDAAEQARQAAARRQGIRRSVMAGDTGGYRNPATGGSLLG